MRNNLKMISAAALFALLVVAIEQVSGIDNLTYAQVNVVPGSSIRIEYSQGADGLWYGYCTEGCALVRTWGTVDQLNHGFDNYYDLVNHYTILRAHAYGMQPQLLPGTSVTPTP